MFLFLIFKHLREVVVRTRVLRTYLRSQSVNKTGVRDASLQQQHCPPSLSPEARRHWALHPHAHAYVSSPSCDMQYTCSDGVDLPKTSSLIPHHQGCAKAGGIRRSSEGSGKLASTCRDVAAAGLQTMMRLRAIQLAPVTSLMSQPSIGGTLACHSGNEGDKHARMASQVDRVIARPVPPCRFVTVTRTLVLGLGLALTFTSSTAKAPTHADGPRSMAWLLAPLYHWCPSVRAEYAAACQQKPAYHH